MGEEDAFTFFVNEMKESIKERAVAANDLNILLAAAGPDVVIKQFVPYLHRLHLKESDEVLVALAAAYGRAADHMGDRVDLLFELIAELLLAHEPNVRTQAVNAVISILNGASKKDKGIHAETCLLDILLKFASTPTYSGRLSFVDLLPSVVPHLCLTSKVRLLENFCSLQSDEVLVVRTRAASSLPELFAALEVSETMRIFAKVKETTWDGQIDDEIREAFLRGVVGLLPRVDGKIAEKMQASTIIKEAVGDASWRVRECAALNFETFLCLDKSETLKVYTQLWKDKEQDIKIATLKSLPGVGKMITEADLSTYVLPNILIFAIDPSPAVRSALGDSLGRMCGYLSTKAGDKELTSTLLNLLADSDQDVSLSVVRHASKITTATTDPRVLQRIVESMARIMTDPQWRLRRSVVEQSIELCTKVSTKVFEANLFQTIIKGFHDPCHGVRMAVSSNLGLLVRTYGTTWACSNLLPAVSEAFYQAKAPLLRVSYLMKINILRTMENISGLISPKEFTDAFLGVLVDAAGDPVANVRIAAFQIASRIKESFHEPNFNSQFMPILKLGLLDPDQFVINGAQSAIAILGK